MNVTIWRFFFSSEIAIWKNLSNWLPNVWKSIVNSVPWVLWPQFLQRWYTIEYNCVIERMRSKLVHTLLTNKATQSFWPLSSDPTWRNHPGWPKSLGRYRSIPKGPNWLLAVNETNLGLRKGSNSILSLGHVKWTCARGWLDSLSWSR